MREPFICPKCKKKSYGYPAVSRVDNKTNICTNCGVMEAVQSYLEHNKNIVAKTSMYEMCECGHMGGSSPMVNNFHQDRHQKGHGECLVPKCGCEKFTWKGFCDEYGKLI